MCSSCFQTGQLPVLAAVDKGESFQKYGHASEVWCSSDILPRISIVLAVFPIPASCISFLRSSRTLLDTGINFRYTYQNLVSSLGQALLNHLRFKQTPDSNASSRSTTPVRQVLSYLNPKHSSIQPRDAATMCWTIRQYEGELSRKTITQGRRTTLTIAPRAMTDYARDLGQKTDRQRGGRIGGKGRMKAGGC